MTIFAGMKRYAEKAVFRGHTPGHKGKLHPLDITEIDNEFPANLITEAEKKAAKLYSAREARLLVGGSSMGIKAAITALGEKLIVPENCHRSVFEAAELARIELIVLPCEVKDDLPTPVSAEKYFEAYKANPDAAVFVQSPDYFGRASDKAVLELKKKGAQIIADSAHGAHFDFCGLKEFSFASYADVCIMSAHKTLPALTMGSVMTINDESLIAGIDHSLKLLGTTSPSYLILGSIEYALDYTDKHRAEYASLRSALRSFVTSIRCLENDDYTRIVVDAAAFGASGVELYDYCKAAGFVPELATDRYTVFIFSIMNTAEEVNALKEVIESYAR